MTNSDRSSKDAQNLLLTYLDRLRPGQAFLGTTHLDLSTLTERLGDAPTITSYC